MRPTGLRSRRRVPRRDPHLRGTPYRLLPRRGSAQTDRRRAGLSAPTNAAAALLRRKAGQRLATSGLVRAASGLRSGTTATSRVTADLHRGAWIQRVATVVLPRAALPAINPAPVPARVAPIPPSPETDRRPHVPRPGTARHPHRAVGRFRRTPVRDRDGRSAPRRNVRPRPARSPLQEPDRRREDRRDRGPCHRSGRARRCHRPRDAELRSVRRAALPHAPVIRADERVRRRRRPKAVPAQANTHELENVCSFRPSAMSLRALPHATLGRSARTRHQQRRHTQP